MRLSLDFYQKDTITLTKDLLGKYLVRNIDGEEVIAKKEIILSLKDKM
ncbi:hypothetical protein [Selenihalanaerobacter shriftii]|uniref:DNA-3-methyladenine glycosylase n=1 Tax=Selenihalanaerobacter shriftii TaxID=142842 RepID=A0A1T4LDA2_9FIRM|nr:hypothetical protein [Selenihalanaerobacter shriftii]SJZ52626.1 DNA-3-methyladenine glycosylase [Selenihalanaerobacter shriftii]